MGSAYEGEHFVFIVGSPRSGTTIAAETLARHPELAYLYEPYYLWNRGSGSGDDDERGASDLDEATVAFIREACHGFWQRSGARFVVEQSPEESLMLPLMRRVLPRARFVHLVRDGRDAAVSCWFHYKRVKPDQVTQRWGGDFQAFLETSAQQWAQETAKGHAAAERWPEQVVELRYEDLLEHPTAALARLARFLGVSDDPGVLEECLAAADFGKLSGGRSPGEEERGSFFRKGVAGDWREHFDPLTEARFETLAGAQLRAYGYETG